MSLPVQKGCPFKPEKIALLFNNPSVNNLLRESLSMLDKQETAIVNIIQFINSQCKVLQKKLELAGEEDLLILADDLEEHVKKVNEAIFAHYEDAKYAPKIEDK